MSGARMKANDEPVLSCASAWILARTSAKDDWLFCDADGVGESFCFLVAGSVVVLASRHVAMGKRVVLCCSKLPHRELDPFITELSFAEGIVSSRWSGSGTCS